MGQLTSPVVLVSLAGGLLAVGITRAAWRNRDEPGAVPFAVLMAGVAIWASSYALGGVVADIGLRRALELPIEVGKALVAPAWLLFALQYTGRGDWITRRLLALLAVIPVVTLVLVATSSEHAILWTNYRIDPVLGAATARFDPGPWHYLHAVYGWLLIGAGMALLLDTVQERHGPFGAQGAALLAGALLPFATHVKRTFMLPPEPALDLTPLALTATGVLFSVALFRFDLLDLVPATRRLGRGAAIEATDVGMLVVETGGRIVECNPAAAAAVGRSASDLVGRDLAEVAPDIALGPGNETVALVGAAGRRTYDVRVAPVTDERGREIGLTVTLTDVTARERRRQRLEVLNRVLRHNLRNDLNVVIGTADQLAERDDPEVASQAERIADRAESLHGVGETARDLEDLIAESDREWTTCRLDEFLAGIVDQYADAPAHIEVVADPVHLRTNEHVLSTVLDNAIENAVEHAGTPDDPPTVRIDASRGADGGVTIRVADDGPGIPPRDRTPIVEGTEGDVSHGSGIGLWVIAWGMDALGGTVGFDDDADGAAICLTLPATMVDDRGAEG
jgi:signal transduction histidine kinase